VAAIVLETTYACGLSAYRNDTEFTIGKLLRAADLARHDQRDVPPVRSPRVLRTLLHAYACRIYAAPFRASTGL
jgi:hypothetical protein